MRNRKKNLQSDCIQILVAYKPGKTKCVTSECVCVCACVSQPAGNRQ